MGVLVPVPIVDPPFSEVLLDVVALFFAALSAMRLALEADTAGAMIAFDVGYRLNGWKIGIKAN
jgi:hypothetical protein